MRLLIALLLLAGCATTEADKCKEWKYDSVDYALGWGRVYKRDLSVCVHFKE
jgi:hypothetical protein